MQYSNFQSIVIPTPDIKLLKSIHDAIIRVKFEPTTITCRFRHIKDDHAYQLSDLIGSKPLKGLIQNKDASLLTAVIITFSMPAGSFSYQNNLSPSNETPPAIHFNFERMGEDEEWPEAISLFTTLIRKSLGAMDGAEGLKKILGPDLKSHLATREQELIRLEGITDTFFTRLQEFEARREENFLQKETELDEKLLLKSKELDNNYEEKVKSLEESKQEWQRQIAEKETLLAEWEDRLEALNNTDERRQTRKQIREELEKRETKFGLTEGTQEKRQPIHIIFLSIIVGSLVLFSLFLWLLIVNYDTSTWSRVILIARVALAGVVFFTTLFYYLRWNMDWFERHASEEFRNKRQILDMDRATWLSEFALEWHGVTDSQVPPEMFEALSRELYVTEGASHNEKKSAADAVASALFGSAATVRGKFGNAEVELDRKATQNMKKSELN